jgi:hypothetical protein
MVSLCRLFMIFSTTGRVELPDPIEFHAKSEAESMRRQSSIATYLNKRGRHNPFFQAVFSKSLLIRTSTLEASWLIQSN